MAKTRMFLRTSYFNSVAVIPECVNSIVITDMCLHRLADSFMKIERSGFGNIVIKGGAFKELKEYV